MGFGDSFSPDGELNSTDTDSQKPIESTSDNTLVSQPETTADTPQVAEPIESAINTDDSIPEAGTVKIINPNLDDRNDINIESPEPNGVDNQAEQPAEPEASAEDSEGYLDVMDIAGKEPEAIQETQVTEEPLPEESTPEITDIAPKSLEVKEKSETELRKEQNIELVKTIYEAHKKAFIKPEDKDYLILRDSKNRVLDINNGSLLEQTGDDYSKYTYIFSEKGISMIVFDERLYDKDYSSNLDALLDADFSENKDDKYIKVTSSDQQRYFEVNVRNCKNIAELDEDGIKDIIEFVEKENPAPIEPDEIQSQTESLKAFFAET